MLLFLLSVLLLLLLLLLPLSLPLLSLLHVVLYSQPAAGATVSLDAIVSLLSSTVWLLPFDSVASRPWEGADKRIFLIRKPGGGLGEGIPRKNGNLLGGFRGHFFWRELHPQRLDYEQDNIDRGFVHSIVFFVHVLLGML